MENVPGSIKIDLLKTMLKIRRFEEKVTDLYPAQDMKTPVHLCIGQEAVAAGVCANLQRQDYIFSTHRNHGHYIAKGGDIRKLVAEFYGRSTGCSKGKGGSMHPVAPECGILGTSAIVGGCIALAVGAALASQMRKDGRVAVAFFGDGAADQGIFHESLNFAALKLLPVVFICENNFYATNSPLSARQPHDNIAKRAEGYQIPGVQVDGNDVRAIFKAAGEAIARARAGGGPTLIECRTYRWRGHVGPDCDYERGCRPKEELEGWMEKCPIELFKDYLFKNAVMDENSFADMGKALDQEMEDAAIFGKGSPFPEATDVFNDVYFEGA